ncbi:hypothetical protein N24_2757 [Corynebacterium suranareeae]|uniref:Uncharacterized protein n=1 Tax=Corynebacterium suranareeae TaxID=2506452 RepID=A0A160PS89_9CORY|nr:hypothetical protein [Corynebacterium suranareeae]BAU97019.1 hypothetical protein N24_2757 [Corynebacterium suranareeae]
MSALSKFVARLADLLKEDSLFLASELTDDDGLLVLTEDEVGQPVRKIKLKDVPAEARVIKIDNFDLNGRFVQTGGGSDLGKRCDYVIVDAQNSKILLIELKLGTKSSGDRQQVVSQLKGGRAVIDYLLALIAHFHNENIEVSSPQFRYAWITYRESTSQKSASRDNGRDIDSPLRIKNAQKRPYSYKKMVR